MSLVRITLMGDVLSADDIRAIAAAPRTVAPPTPALADEPAREVSLA